MTDIESIIATGEALYGRSWREPLARALQRPGAGHAGVDWRLLRHWVDGTRPVAAWVMPECIVLLRHEARVRQRTLTALATSIEASTA